MQYLFLLAVAPIFFLLLYIKKKDPNPEPKDLLKKIFLFGCLMVFPVIVCEIAYEFLFIGEKETESFIDVFLGVAFIEEFFKWIVVYLICFRSKHFDETYDAIVYSAYSSLAFACVENIGYVVLDGDMTVGIIRALTAVPGHLCNGIIMGYYLSKARSAKAQNKSAFGLLLCSLFVPALIHCLYDYFLEIEAIILWIIYFIVVLILCVSTVKKSARNNIAITSREVETAQSTTTQTNTISYDWSSETQSQPPTNTQA